MRKGRPKVGPVDVGLSRTLGEEESVTSGTKYIDGVVPWQVGQAYWQDGLALTKHGRTPSESCQPIFFIHSMHPSIGNNISTYSIAASSDI
jgi:hypothetical protein